MADIQLPNHIPNVFLGAAFHSPNGYIHAGQVEVDKHPENGALKAMAEALGYGRLEGESINSLRANPDEDLMPAQHDRAVRERCAASQAKFAEKFDNAKAGLQRELSNVEAGLVTKAGLTPNPSHFDAITAAFHQMKPSQRAETIADLIAQGDHASLATLIEAPLFLTGLKAEERDAIKERVFHAIDPMGVALRDHLKVVLGRVEHAANASVGMFAALSAGTAPGAWKARGQDAAAKAAARR